MSGEHEERGPAVTEVNGDVVAGSKNVTINYNGGGGGEGPWQPPEAVGRYLAWLAIDKALVNLRGIGGGGIELPLAAVYVPLRLTRSEGQEIDAGKWKRRARGEGGDFEISAMFGHLSQDPRRSEDRHALILGEPGSGKSTAMRKLELLIRDQARCAKGERLPAREGVDEALCADTLAREYVPVRVPLRDFTRADLEVSLRDFVDREVKKRSKGQIDEATIAALWAHGKVVLILDGLDEIAEVAARDGFCSKLNNFAASRDHGSVRIVVTSRIGGYRELSVRPDNRFALVRLQPLSAEQAKRLIGQWFHALVGEVENFSDGDADARTDELSRAIEDGRFSDLRRSMYATPLIATLLCVLNYRSCRMPESRVEFYDTCLRMLLETWPESKQDGAEAGRRAERPLTTTKAIEILATLAHELHAGPTGEQLHRDVILARLGALLGAAKAKKREVFAWLHKDAAIFEELAPCEFGFFHLGVQEYLAALHVAMCGEHAIRGLAVRLGEARWSEVLLMTGALPLRGAFAPLMHELLGRFDPNDKDDEDFLRLAVREGAFEITPFVAHLADASISGAKAQKVLSFVEQRREVELTEPAGRLAERARAMAAPLPEGSVERAVWAAVEARAMQLVAAIKRDERSEAEGEYDVAVVGLDEALQARQALLHHLRTSQKRALRVWPPDGDGEPLGALDVEAVTSAVEAVLVVLVDQAPWQDPGSRAAAQLCLLAQERPLTLVLARGATVSLDKAPEYVLERAPIEQRAGGNVEAIVERLRPGGESGGEWWPGGGQVGAGGEAGVHRAEDADAVFVCARRCFYHGERGARQRLEAGALGEGAGVLDRADGGDKPGL
jgi:hypothetical protein